MLDIFANNPAFSLGELTLGLIQQPYVPRQIGRLGIFREERLTTTGVFIETRGSRLALVPEMPRGAPPTPNVEDLRSMVAFRVPHFPIRDTIMADSVQNIRAFGTSDQLEAVQSVVNQHETSIGIKLDATLEYLRLGAVKGVIITRVDRVTGQPIGPPINLFDRFEVDPQPVLEWPIVNAGRDGQEAAAWEGQLTGLVNQLGRLLADEVPGGMFMRIQGVCGSQFFDAFTGHPERRAAFIALDNAPLLDPNLGRRVSFRDVTIEEYRGGVGGMKFVEPDVCHFFPEGVPDLFIDYFAPADYMEAVNTLALPRYLKMETMEFDKGVQLEAQMNVLPLCTLPRTLFTVRVTPWQPAEAAGATRAPQGSVPAHRERATAR